MLNPFLIFLVLHSKSSEAIHFLVTQFVAAHAVNQIRDTKWSHCSPVLKQDRLVLVQWFSEHDTFSADVHRLHEAYAVRSLTLYLVGY